MNPRVRILGLGGLVLLACLLTLTLQARLSSRLPGRQDAVAVPVERTAPPPATEASGTEPERVELEPTSGEPGEQQRSAPLAGDGQITLEIQVWRAGGIAHDTRAWIVSGFHREFPGDPREPGDARVPATADAQGWLRFSGLDLGAYRVLLALDDLRLEQAVRLVEGPHVVRVVIHLGAAAIEGFAFDDRGAPCSDALVLLCRPGYGRNPPPHDCFVRTDANGFYRLPQVGSGLQSVTVFPGGAVGDGGRRRETIMPFSGVVRLDFGEPAQSGVLWSGVLRNAEGEPVPGPGEIRIHDEGQDEVRTGVLRADGSFELRLRPGAHHLWVVPAGFFPRQVDLGNFAVPPSDWRQDLVLPGARLHLALALPPDLEGAPEITLRSEHEGMAVRRLTPLPDGSWVHDGLEPGRYALGVTSLRFATTHAAEFAFELEAGARRLDLDLGLERAP